MVQTLWRPEGRVLLEEHRYRSCVWRITDFPKNQQFATHRSATMIFANRISSSTSCSIWPPETSPPSSSRGVLRHRFESCNTSLNAAAGSGNAQREPPDPNYFLHRPIFAS